jgi:anti-sigma B factor antagonist
MGEGDSVPGSRDEASGLREGSVKDVSENEGSLIVELAGELDLYNAEELRSALHEATARTPARLVIDLSGVEFIDSTALGVLVEARRRLANRRAFLLAGPGRDVRRTLEVSGLDRHFGVFESVDAALLAKV